MRWVNRFINNEQRPGREKRPSNNGRRVTHTRLLFRTVKKKTKRHGRILKEKHKQIRLLTRDFSNILLENPFLFSRKPLDPVIGRSEFLLWQYRT